MPAGETETDTRGTAARRNNGHATGARAATPERTGGAAPRGAPRPEETWNGGRFRHGSEREPFDGQEAAALRGLLHGLRAGDLECVLLTVAMAADENRMPSTDPDEAERILTFLARLAEHDAMLPPCPDGAGSGPDGPPDGTGAADGAPALG